MKIVSYLLKNFGWRHEKAGSEYPIDEKSFRQTLRSGVRSPRGFRAELDNLNRRIVITFDYDSIEEDYFDWKRTLLIKKIESSYTPYWGFADMFHKAGAKMGNCFFVAADHKIEDNREYFWYNDIKMLSNFSLERFLEAFETGKIFIDFDARTHHNHGTKVRIKSSDIPLLYETIRVI